jgi:undecaprenyl-diphosphatase
MSTLSYAEAMVIGLVQGVSELFPVSSLGHSVLLPALIGGHWAQDLDMSAPGSPYLDTLVAMHVATAVALVIFFRKDWIRLMTALVSAVRHRRIATVDERLVWLLVIGTIPVGLAGLALDKAMREYLGKPVPAALFLAVNGVVLFAVERLHRRSRSTGARHRRGQPELEVPGPTVTGPDAPTLVLPAVGADGRPGQPHSPAGAGSEDAVLAALSWREALGIGACQMFALLPGISRSGATIAGGLLRGMSHQDAARFAFLLATPVIAAAGLLKIPELTRPEMHDAVGPAFVGSVVAGLGAYVSVRFLTSYFHTRTLTPFAVYCLVSGLGCLAWFSLS